MPRSNHAPSKRKRGQEKRFKGRPGKVKVCLICREYDGKVDYKDVALLRRFMSDRAKIRSSRVTGNCPRHQRKVANAIKNAREMALLPYTNR